MIAITARARAGAARSWPGIYVAPVVCEHDSRLSLGLGKKEKKMFCLCREEKDELARRKVRGREWGYVGILGAED